MNTTGFSSLVMSGVIKTGKLGARDQGFNPLMGTSNSLRWNYSSDPQNLVPVKNSYVASLLPTIKGKFQDIPSISHYTMEKVLKGYFGGPFVIVDCRYPYEHQGGHIVGAKNIYTKTEIMDVLFPRDIESNLSVKPTLIFHCEFSSVRGPNMYRFVRSIDEKLNNGSDKSLYYPNMYLLKFGYCNFYAKHKEYCSPPSYQVMVDEESIEDFLHFYVRKNLMDKEASSEEEALEKAYDIVDQYFPSE